MMMEPYKKLSAQGICKLALERWGAGAQTTKAFEEMAELQKELCKHSFGAQNKEQIAEEIADVRIMLEQMELLHGCAGMADKIKRRKLYRLAQRLGVNQDGD